MARPTRIEKFKGEFFKILETTPHSQLAVQTIMPGEDAGPAERHPGDQIIYVIGGEAEIELEGGKPFRANAGDVLVIPKAALHHHVKSVGPDPLFYLTVYAPLAY